MTHPGSKTLRHIRTLLPEWQAAVSEVSNSSAASEFAKVIGGIFASAVHDERLTADENWEAFLAVMYAKVGTLRDLGFTYDAVLASWMCSSEERAFSVMHVIDDFMGKSDVDGFIEREKTSLNEGEMVSVNANLTAAFSMVRHFGIDQERSEFLQECIEYLEAALNHPRDREVALKLRELQQTYLRDRNIFRETMWRCVTDISPAWIVGDTVRAGTQSEIFSSTAEMLEVLAMQAFNAVHLLGQPNDESLAWAKSLNALLSALRARGADAGNIISVILAAETDLLNDERLAIPLQRLARAGILSDYSNLAAHPDTCKATR